MRRAIIVGRSRGALDEYRAALKLGDFHDVLVVGMMATSFPYRVDHLVSFHAELFDMWAEQRTAAGFSPVGCFWGATYKGRNLGADTTRAQPLRYAPCLGGSSGFLAVSVALEALGADRVVLAGVPMRAEDAHHGDAQRWDEADQYWPTWLEHMGRLVGLVKSMSGRTREALGAPTREWLNVSGADA